MEGQRGMLSLVLFSFLIASTTHAAVRDVITDEGLGLLWLEYFNQHSMDALYDVVDANWNYNTNITENNMMLSLEAASRYAEFEKKSYDQAMKFDWGNFSKDVRREFEKVTDIGPAALPDDKFTRLNSLLSAMQAMYSTAEVCNRPGDEDPNTCYPLDPDLTDIMSKSTDWDELVWAWEGWRNESSRRMPGMYESAVELMNEGAVLNGYEDNGEYWRSWYETENFEEEMGRLWSEIKPLYEQLHAYVRRELKTVYADNYFPASGHIPAHLLGDMWAQQWNDIERLVLPFPDKPSIDVTREMIKQGYDTTKMFELSEDFFISLGLDGMPPTFWTDSMLEKPDDGRDVVCHASAWDFYNQQDFRVKQCTKVDMNWLITTHHEMGHIEYFLLYKHLHTVFRDGANPGFHEAIGDVLELSVSTPEHLHKIGLLPDYVPDEEVDLNAQMAMVLKKIAFLPFGYLIDQWRWDVFRGEVTKENYNSAWWRLRCDIQGLTPPVERSNELDFDPGSKFHIPNNTPYIRYFVSHILQFQFHKALCNASGHEGPLHKCDIYHSDAAGKLFREMMEVGSSELWPDVLERLTGSRDMDTAPLMEYFKPILDWLKEENKDHDVGWTSDCPAATN